eukprot:g1339.t1
MTFHPTPSASVNSHSTQHQKSPRPPQSPTSPTILSGYLRLNAGARLVRWKSSFFKLTCEELQYSCPGQTEITTDGMLSVLLADISAVSTQAKNKVVLQFRDAARPDLILLAPTSSAQQEWAQAIEAACLDIGACPQPLSEVTTQATTEPPRTPQNAAEGKSNSPQSRAQRWDFTSGRPASRAAGSDASAGPNGSPSIFQRLSSSMKKRKKPERLNPTQTAAISTPSPSRRHSPPTCSVPLPPILPRECSPQSDSASDSSASEATTDQPGPHRSSRNSAFNSRHGSDDSLQIARESPTGELDAAASSPIGTEGHPSALDVAFPNSPLPGIPESSSSPEAILPADTRHSSLELAFPFSPNSPLAGIPESSSDPNGEATSPALTFLSPQHSATFLTAANADSVLEQTNTLADVGGGADSIFSPPPGWAASQSTSPLSPPLSALSAIDEGGGSQPDLSSLSNNNDDNDNNDSNDTNDTDTDSSISFPVHLFPSPSRSLPPQPLQAPPAPPSSASPGLPAQPSATSSAPAVPTLVYTSSPPPPPPGIPPPPPPASLPSSDSMPDLSTLSTLRASLSSPDPSPHSLSALRVSSVPVSSDTSDTESAEEDETAPAPPPLPPASPAHRLTRHRRHTSSDLEVSLRRQPSRSSTPPPPLAEGREATEVTSMAPTMATGKPRTPRAAPPARPLQASARASPPVRHRRNSHGHGSGNHAHGSPARRGSTDHAHGSPARRGSRSHNESPDPSPLRPPKDLRIDSSTPQGFSQKHINKTRPRAHSDSQSDLMPPPVPAIAMSAHPLVVPPQTTRPGLPGARTNFASPPRKPVIPAPPATSSHATTSTHAAAGAGPERPPLAKQGSAVNVVKDNGSPLSMLHQILANPAQQELLMTFLTKEFSEENLLFWRAVKALQEKWEETVSATSPATSPDERPLMLALLEQMQSLWAEFVQPGADKQINVPYGVVKSIRAKLDALKCFASPEKKSDSGNQSTPGKKPSPPQRIPPPVPILGAAPPESPAADTTEDKDKENDKDEGNDENKLASPAQHKTKTAHLVTPSGASPMKLTPRAKHSKHTEAVREAIEAFVESSAVVSQLIARDSLQRFLKSAIWLEREDNPENKAATGENKALAGDKQVAKGKSKVQAGANKVARLRLGGWGGRSGLEEGSTLSPREQEQNFEKAAAIVRELETRPVESWTKEERDAYRTQSQSLKGSKSHQTGRTWRRPASELQAMLTAGQAALGEGLKDYAVGYFSQVLKTQPGHVEALVLRSRAHREMGNTELARKDALRASVVDNQYAPAHFALGQVYVDVRMLELAELELFRAYRLDPDLAGLATPLLQVSRQNHRRVPIRSGFLRRRTEGGWSNMGSGKGGRKKGTRIGGAVGVLRGRWQECFFELYETLLVWDQDREAQQQEGGEERQMGVLPLACVVAVDTTKPNAAKHRLKLHLSLRVEGGLAGGAANGKPPGEGKESFSLEAENRDVLEGWLADLSEYVPRATAHLQALRGLRVPHASLDLSQSTNQTEHVTQPIASPTNSGFAIAVSTMPLGSEAPTSSSPARSMSSNSVVASSSASHAPLVKAYSTADLHKIARSAPVSPQDRADQPAKDNRPAQPGGPAGESASNPASNEVYKRRVNFLSNRFAPPSSSSSAPLHRSASMSHTDNMVIMTMNQSLAAREGSSEGQQGSGWPCKGCDYKDNLGQYCIMCGLARIAPPVSDYPANKLLRAKSDRGLSEVEKTMSPRERLLARRHSNSTMPLPHNPSISSASSTSLSSNSSNYPPPPPLPEIDDPPPPVTSSTSPVSSSVEPGAPPPGAPLRRRSSESMIRPPPPRRYSLTGHVHRPPPRDHHVSGGASGVGQGAAGDIAEGKESAAAHGEKKPRRAPPQAANPRHRPAASNRRRRSSPPPPPPSIKSLQAGDEDELDPPPPPTISPRSALNSMSSPPSRKSAHAHGFSQQNPGGHKARTHAQPHENGVHQTNNGLGKGSKRPDRGGGGVTRTVNGGSAARKKEEVMSIVWPPRQPSRYLAHVDAEVPPPPTASPAALKLPDDSETSHNPNAAALSPSPSPKSTPSRKPPAPQPHIDPTHHKHAGGDSPQPSPSRTFTALQLDDHTDSDEESPIPRGKAKHRVASSPSLPPPPPSSTTSPPSSTSSAAASSSTTGLHSLHVPSNGPDLPPPPHRKARGHRQSPRSSPRNRDRDTTNPRRNSTERRNSTDRRPLTRAPKHLNAQGTV